MQRCIRYDGRSLAMKDPDGGTDVIVEAQIVYNRG